MTKKNEAYTVVFHNIKRTIILGASSVTEAIEDARETFKKVTKQEYNGPASAWPCEDTGPNA